MRRQHRRAHASERQQLQRCKRLDRLRGEYGRQRQPLLLGLGHHTCHRGRGVERTNNYNPTDVNTFNEDVLTPQTDVVMYDEDYTGSTCGYDWMEPGVNEPIVGLVVCHSLSGLACQQFKVYYDLDFMGPRSSTEENWLACHETGHTLGLTHTSTGVNCMQYPGNGTPALTSHDVNDHLNPNYN